MHNIWIRDDFGRENTVPIAFPRWHQAVGRVKDRRRNAVELFLLILPCGTEVTLELRIFPECRVGMGWQHLPVGIDIDTFIFGLFEKRFKVAEVMACDNDERSFLNSQGDFCRFRMTESLGVCLIEQRHGSKVDFADFEHDRQEFIHAKTVIADSGQCFIEKALHIRIAVAEDMRMVNVRCHTFDAEEDQRLQRTDVLIPLPEGSQSVIGHIGTAEGCFFNFNAVFEGIDGGIVKADIGDGGKETVQHKLIGHLGNGIRVSQSGTGEAYESAGQTVLKIGSPGFLSADTGAASTPFTACSLFTLKTKHGHCPFSLPENISGRGYVRQTRSSRPARGSSCRWRSTPA